MRTLPASAQPPECDQTVPSFFPVGSSDRAKLLSIAPGSPSSRSTVLVGDRDVGSASGGNAPDAPAAEWDLGKATHRMVLKPSLRPVAGTTAPSGWPRPGVARPLGSCC